MEKSSRKNSAALIETIKDLKVTIEKQPAAVGRYRKESEFTRQNHEAKDDVNRILAEEISNLRYQFENNRNHDKSVMEKSEYDGSCKKNDENSSNGNQTGGNTLLDGAINDVGLCILAFFKILFLSLFFFASILIILQIP